MSMSTSMSMSMSMPTNVGASTAAGGLFFYKYFMTQMIFGLWQHLFGLWQHLSGGYLITVCQ